MEKTFEIFYKFKNFDESIYRFIPGLKKRMQSELLDTYNIYADRTNQVIAKLNNEFENLYPNYFEENKGKDFYELKLYNNYMRLGFQKVVDEINNENYDSLMAYKVGEELQLIGNLRHVPEIEIEFYMKELD